MKAVKGNKEYTINEASQKGYQDMGFDILDEDGKVVAYGRGKTVPYGDYVSLMEENKKLHSRIAELEAATTMASESEKKAGPKKAGD